MRTYRALGPRFTRQTNLAGARLEYQSRRVDVAAGRNRYEEKQPREKPKAEPAKLTAKEVIQLYVEKEYPDRYLTRPPLLTAAKLFRRRSTQVLNGILKTQMLCSITPPSRHYFLGARVRTAPQDLTLSGNTCISC